MSLLLYKLVDCAGPELSGITRPAASAGKTGGSIRRGWTEYDEKALPLGCPPQEYSFRILRGAWAQSLL